MLGAVNNYEWQMRAKLINNVSSWDAIFWKEESEVESGLKMGVAFSSVGVQCGQMMSNVPDGK